MSDTERPPWYGTGRPDREANGYFAKGNAVTLGRTGDKRIGALRRAAREAATPEEVVEVLAHFRSLFLKFGDTVAGRTWLEYTVGKPSQAIEVSGPEGGPARIDLRAVAGLILKVAGDDEDRRALALQLVKQLGPPVEDASDGPGA
jgi:hypothetical protein